jgi:hypothetical protein
MSPEILVSLLPLLMLWAVYRIGRYAVGPLLADARAATTMKTRLDLPRPAAQRARMRPVQAAVLAGLTFAGLWFAISSGMTGSLQWLSIPFSETFIYTYYAAYDLILNLVGAVGLLLFARSGLRRALTAFFVLSAFAFLADFIFNLGGSFFFESNMGLYGGGEMGYSVWLIYYFIFIVLYLTGMTFFCDAFKNPVAWISVLVLTLTTGALTLGGPLLSYINDLGLNYAFLAASVVMAAVVGWWLRPNDNALV